MNVRAIESLLTTRGRNSIKNRTGKQMKIRNGQIGQLAQLARQLAGSETKPTKVSASSLEANAPITARTSQETKSIPPRSTQFKKTHEGNSGGDETSHWALRAAKYAAGAAGAAYAYDKTANNFFLSTTSLHDGKGGFSSNARLDKAYAQGKEYVKRFHTHNPDCAGAWPASSADYFRERKLDRFSPLSTCGNNQFLSMTDYRAATKLHLEGLMDTPQAQASLVKSLTCLKGALIKPELVEKYNPPNVPKDFDLTKTDLYSKKGKYALLGVPNEETGARGYVSRTITRPFVNKGLKHFRQDSAERGASLKQHVDKLEAILEKDGKFSKEAQFAAGLAILNFRQVYADDQHWGHAEKVVMKTLEDQGLLLKAETEKIDETLLFEDPSKSVFTRNTSVMGPLFQKIDTRIHEHLLAHDPEALKDFMYMAEQKNIEGLPIAHFKVNEQWNGFEDASGLGDSFTSANAVAAVNHARLMSGEPPLSKEDVAVLVACLNTVYDDASGIRHTLHEVARGCFAGAGHTTEDADLFYGAVCKKAAEEFYGGKALEGRA